MRNVRILAYGAAFVLVALLMAYVTLGPGKSSSASLRAEGVVDLCSEEGGDRSMCYEREIPKMLPELSLTQVFDVIRKVRVLDPSYQFCHVLAHKLGERTVAEDPDSWIDAIPLNPVDGLCSNGFIHGVTGGRFRAEVLSKDTLEKLIPDFSRACAPRPTWSPSDLDRAICSHGMGHLYMFITDAEIPLALNLCEETMPEEYRRVCREGVFMQIYQPLEPDDFLLIERMPVKPTRETVRSFCARYEKDAYEGACLRESWPFFREEVMTGEGITEFCAGQPGRSEEVACYESSFALAGRLTLADPDVALRICGAVGDAWKEMCYSSSARTFLEEDRMASQKAIDFCAIAPAPYDTACLRNLVDTAVFIFGETPAYEAFCRALPSELKARCRR